MDLLFHTTVPKSLRGYRNLSKATLQMVCRILGRKDDWCELVFYYPYMLSRHPTEIFQMYPYFIGLKLTKSVFAQRYAFISLPPNVYASQGLRFVFIWRIRIRGLFLQTNLMKYHTKDLYDNNITMEHILAANETVA